MMVLDVGRPSSVDNVPPEVEAAGDFLYALTSLTMPEAFAAFGFVHGRPWSKLGEDLAKLAAHVRTLKREDHNKYGTRDNAVHRSTVGMTLTSASTRIPALKLYKGGKLGGATDGDAFARFVRAILCEADYTAVLIVANFRHLRPVEIGLELGELCKEGGEVDALAERLRDTKEARAYVRGVAARFAPFADILRECLPRGRWVRQFIGWQCLPRSRFFRVR